MEGCRPRIILSAAMSIDGKIAARSGDSRLSSEKDMIRLHKLRSRTDAILVGRNTVVRDDPLLTVRLAKGKNPIRIILASSGTLPRNCKILKTCSDVPTIIAVSRKISEKRLAMLQKLPIDVIVTGTESVNLKSLMRILAKRGITTILVEGGGTVNWEFIKAGLFDEIYLTISPHIIGGTKTVSLVQGRGFATIRKAVKLHLGTVTRLDDCLVLHYKKT